MITHEDLIRRGFKLRKGMKFGYWFKDTDFGGLFIPNPNGEFLFYSMSSTFITSLKDLDAIIEMIEYER